MTEKALFLTGVTGFVGSNLLRRLTFSPVYRAIPVFVIARNLEWKTAEHRVKELIPDFSGRVIQGDICQSGLGMSNDDREMLKQFDLEIFHIAGNTNFAKEEAEEVNRVNLIGTKNVLQFAEDFSVQHFHYVSTAYIAGDRTKLSDDKASIAYENEIYVGQRFRNPYEESKCKAEILVQNETKRLGLTTRIYRIGAVVGRYDTGSVTSFDGYYNYMMGFKVLRDNLTGDLLQYKRDGVLQKNGTLHIPLRIWGLPYTTVNIGCADYIVDIIVRIAEKHICSGMTFHVVNPDPPRLGWLLETSFKVLQIEGIQVLDPNTHIQGFQNFPLKETKLEKRVNRITRYYQGYMKGEPIFDNRNVREVLGSVPEHPKIDRELIEKLLGYAIKVNFGKIYALS